MGRPSISFNRAKGGLGRPLPGQDHYSGFITYTGSLPAGYGSDKIKQIFSIEEAEALGISADIAPFKAAHYHISEFFRMQPKGVLWVMFETPPADPGLRDWAEVQELQFFAEGLIRQIGIFDVVPFLASDVTKLQGVVTGLQGENMPTQIIYGADFLGFTDITTLDDLRALEAPNVSACLTESGSGLGPTLTAELTASITAVGNTLGTVALSAVHENIGWKQKFPIDDGTELAVALLANGDNIEDLTSGQLDSINDKGYIIPRKFVGDPATYYTDGPTSVTVADDFAYIENNRTIDKAIRDIHTFVDPKLNSPLYVNPDGTLSEATITVFKDLTEQPLTTMEGNGELSAFEVIINPKQDVLSTSKLEITVVLVPVGVARQIVFNIGFATNLG